MIYDIVISASIPIERGRVRARNRKAVEKIVDKLVKEKGLTLAGINASIRSSVSLSEDNYKCKIGGVYLVKMGHKFFPAMCTSSSLGWREYRAHYRWWKHSFKRLDNNQRIEVKVKHHILCNKIKLLCRSTRIGKKMCGRCTVKYLCYTSKISL